jgi:hypothetical protein
MVNSEELIGTTEYLTLYTDQALNAIQQSNLLCGTNDAKHIN